MTTTPLRYLGTKAPLFRLALGNAFLSLITLGIYRFWGKTRIRKYIWSSVSLDGDALEYSGTGLEKFLGFLVAVVVLAIYLGLVQLALFYFGMHFILNPTSKAEMLRQMAVIYISAFAVLPLTIFARYRARRYMLARTRLRGIRFGMEKAALGYVWRTLAHGTLSLVTLGVLLPRQTYWLEKYKTDRSWYGDMRFEQGGRWSELYGAMTHLFIGVALVVAAGVIGWLKPTVAPLAVTLGSIGYIWGLVGYVHYRVQSFGYLTRHKHLGPVQFGSNPSTGTVIGTYLWGVFMLALAGFAFMLVVGAVVFITTKFAFGAGVDSNGPASKALFFLSFGVPYLIMLLVFSAMALVLITQPLIAHFVETARASNADAIANAHQRVADAGADADGFADALDIGAAI